jgi:DNA-binding transcriptional LysR family regulator
MLEEDATSLLESAGRLTTGHLRVGSIAPRSATRYLSAFRARYPEIEVSLAFGNSASVLEDVLACRIDVGILGGHGDHVECEAQVLSEPEIVLLTNTVHPAAARGTLSREQFAQETLLLREPGSETRDLVLARMDEMDYRPRAVIEIGSREGVSAAAAVGLGIAAVSAEEMEPSPSARILRFADFAVSGVIHAVCLKRRLDTQLIRAFFAVVKLADSTPQ